MNFASASENNENNIKKIIKIVVQPKTHPTEKTGKEKAYDKDNLSEEKSNSNLTPKNKVIVRLSKKRVYGASDQDDSHKKKLKEASEPKMYFAEKTGKEKAYDKDNLSEEKSNSESVEKNKITNTSVSALAIDILNEFLKVVHQEQHKNSENCVYNALSFVEMLKYGHLKNPISASQAVFEIELWKRGQITSELLISDGQFLESEKLSDTQTVMIDRV